MVSARRAAIVPAPHAARAIAFAGTTLVAEGDAVTVAAAVTAAVQAGLDAELLVFDSVTSEPIALDLRRGAAEIADDLEAFAADERGPGRPRLGVVGREVTLLPRHWDWLSAQPGGASATIRRLIDEARGTSVERDRVRTAQERCYRFLSAMLGNAPHFEEVASALFERERGRFFALTERWPRDPRNHARRLAESVFAR